MLIERSIQSLVEQRTTHGKEQLTKLHRVRRRLMRFERVLILPDFHQRGMVRTADLLQHVVA
jgi:hypothetical protein